MSTIKFICGREGQKREVEIEARPWPTPEMYERGYVREEIIDPARQGRLKLKPVMEHLGPSDHGGQISASIFGSRGVDET
jgi:hypothetical protein